MSRISKQVLVTRKKFLINGELRKLRTGKFCSQLAHASLGAILNLMDKHPSFKYTVGSLDGEITYEMKLKRGSALHDWITGSFTKVTLCVETEEELVAVYNKAKEAGLISCLITDSGRTEFNNIPTITCCSILGWSDEVDPITGHLELF